jgi:hypothetical protein
MISIFILTFWNDSRNSSPMGDFTVKAFSSREKAEDYCTKFTCFYPRIVEKILDEDVS